MIKYKSHTIYPPSGYIVSEVVRKSLEDTLKRVDDGEQSAVILPLGWVYHKE